MASTNVQFLKNNNLYEAHKHFMRLSEAYIPTVLPEEELDEEGEDPNQDPNAMGGDSNGMDNSPMDGGQAPNGMEDPMGGDANGMDAQGSDAMGDQDPMGDGPNAMGDGDMGADLSDDPMSDPMNDPMDDDEQEDDGSTIDIDDLTKIQDKLNVKQNHIGRDLSKVDNRITTLIDTIGNLLNKIDTNNSEIEALKSEFEKRNPTQTEKLNLRSLDSYPFNVKPTDYWAQKAQEGGYEAYADNEQPTSQEYVITNDDVDNPSRDIADTFFKIDDDDIQTLDKIFKL